MSRALRRASCGAILVAFVVGAGCASTTSTEPTGAPPAVASFASFASTPRHETAVVTKASASLSAPLPPSTPALHSPTRDELARYTWLDGSQSIRSLADSIPPPPGFTRVVEDDGSFAAWLRGLPLRAPFTPVKTFSGSVLRPSDDPRISAVAEIDVGAADLQQCADSVIRMHAEWLWSTGDRPSIAYHFLSGEIATWEKYAGGQRPTVDGNKVIWKTSAKPNSSRATFRKYLDVVFTYASTISLAQHSAVISKSEIAPGDFFILPGGPGHAVLVLDVATNAEGRKVALLGQGYMPAQDFQVLHPEGASAWFSLDGDAVETPFWVPFPWTSLHRFPSGASKP